MRTIKAIGGIVILSVLAGCGGSADEPSPVASAVETLSGAVCSTGQTVRRISGHVVPALPSAGGALGRDAFQLPEVPEEVRIAEAAGPQSSDESRAPQTSDGPVVNRSLSKRHAHARNARPSAPLTVPIVESTPVAAGHAGLVTSFNGVNLRDQRLANGGNQFTVEPPDQALCVGNGFVLESTNDVLRVFDTTGKPLTGVIDLNTFYGYPPAIDRTTTPPRRGPFVTDPSCYFDADTQRWFHVVLTLDVNPADGAFLGPNHLDVAVSATADPTGSWVIHQVPVQDDGSNGTPDHHCSMGPCIGDFPHIGADRHGFYITTNEYSLFGPEFKSAQVYAFSKTALASGASEVTVVQFDTSGAVEGRQPGFTIWPATSPAGTFVHGPSAEFFLSSNAAEEATAVAGGTFSNQVVLWALSNSTSLNSATPCLTLSNTILSVDSYGIPPAADQKAGNVPLAECLNANCLGLGVPKTPEVEGPLDSSDSRMLQVWSTEHSVYGALDTIVNVGGEDRAGVAFFIVRPELQGGGRVAGRLLTQGHVAVAGNNVIYPAVAVRPDSRGILGFTLVGRDHYPSAGYAALTSRGVAEIRVAAEGLGPQDGFSEYPTVSGRPRWGDYGAAVTDGSNIWIASEYIGQTCTFAEYSAPPLGSCSGTRVTLGNWATRISAVAS